MSAPDFRPVMTLSAISRRLVASSFLRRPLKLLAAGTIGRDDAARFLRFVAESGRMPGFRVPSLNKRIAARTSWKRFARHSLGLKAPRGWGWLTNPKKAAYNRIYYRTTIGIDSFFKPRRRKKQSKTTSIAKQQAPKLTTAWNERAERKARIAASSPCTRELRVKEKLNDLYNMTIIFCVIVFVCACLKMIFIK